MSRLLFLLTIFSLGSVAQAFDHTHAAWTVLLQKHVVVNGPVSQVNYVDFKKDERALADYTHSLSDVTPKEYTGFSQEQKMAFLINAYNAFTLSIVLQHYPVKSIKDIGSLFKNTWKIKFFKLLGEDMNLDGIEHENLRKNFKEPRVHFAVNCASVGCPALRNEAYVFSKLGEQLDAQARLFLRDRTRNRVDAIAAKLELSMIFKWFHEDFERNGSSVQKFIANYITDDSAIRSRLLADAFTLNYLDYDWSLNKTGG